MSWYTTGTVTVTNGSPTVTGSGTSWAANVRQGWVFQGPDGRAYQVLAVNSNTSITLARNYAGSTLAGQQYDLFPTQGEIRDLAAQAAALVAAVGAMVNGAGAGKFSAGAAATPGVANAADVDTGWFWPAPNTLAASTAGTEALRVDAGNRLLIGGTANFSPASGVSPGLQVQGAGFSAATASVQAFSADINGSNLYFSKSRSGTVGTHAVVQSGDTLGTVRFGGSDGTNVIPGAQITATVDGTPGTNDMPGRLSFLTTADGASSASERMRIDSAGKVTAYNAASVLGNTTFGNSSDSPVRVGISRLGGAVETPTGGYNGGTALALAVGGGVASSGCALSICANPQGASAVYLCDTDDAIEAGITYDHATDQLSIRGQNNNARILIDSVGNVITDLQTTVPTLDENSTMVFTRVNNTTLRISMRGGDGVTRAVNLTLA
jgi:hypothetical protein